MFGRHPADAEFAKALAKIVLDPQSVARPVRQGAMKVCLMKR